MVYLTDYSPEAMVTAIENNAVGFYINQANAVHTHLDETDSMIRIMSDIPFPIGNAITRARFAGMPEEIQEAVENALNPFKAHNIPMAWIIDSASVPTNLGSYLEQAGLHRAPRVPGMAAPIESLTSPVPIDPAVTVERVTDEATMQLWVDVFEEVFGIPTWAADFWFNTLVDLRLTGDLPLRHYVALLDGQVVGSSSLLLWDGVAGIYNVATLHDVRERGIGTASTIIPLRDAYAEGYRVGVLQSSQMAMSLYRKLGFKEYCRFGAYVWMGTRPEEH